MNFRQYTMPERSVTAPMHGKKVRFTLLLLLTISMLPGLLTACGGDAHLQQQAQQDQNTFDKTLQQAQDAGVPLSVLQPLMKQQQSLKSSSAPWPLFNGNSVDEYYSNLSTRYNSLTVQTQGLVDATTDRFHEQASTDLQRLQTTLANKQKDGLPLDTLNKLYNTGMDQQKKAKYPKDYAAISVQAKDAVSTINMMPSTLEKLDTLKEIISLMQEGHQDTGDLQKQYDANYKDISKATKPGDLTAVGKNIDKQSESATASFQKIIPQLAQDKIDAYDKQVKQLKDYGVDTSSYDKTSTSLHDQAQKVKTLKDFLAFEKAYNNGISGMQLDLLKGKATSEIKKFHAKVDSWGNSHLYHNPYDGKNYAPNMGYMTKGIGEDLDNELAAAKTLTDYQAVVTDVENESLHLEMFIQDFSDGTPYSQPHATDTQLMQHYKLLGSQVIVVSFAEQAMRVYNGGQLVRAFQITAGRPELPAVPGLWPEMWRKTKTVFKSPYPKGSPYYYDDTKINYAILYHSGGYFLHDSWWRNDYGPGTQYFHIDSSGNSSANYGTHGCVNMPLDQAKWVYDNTSYSTSILMY
ncbi:L,D-transpeptidase [Ktedonospora formicarum]|uniref:L,D-TPase catalytic domain-containing protein n=1 Tax=Ktedonospora formicarum TaxID=2778364 RepID=A0A8J3I4I9_9CHLR|nr:L,D-transpeptidase [Ktedonospora formicarum]GHO49319.1 hypothetical protein KSX_74820 [Ktedonospora formicarum]